MLDMATSASVRTLEFGITARGVERLGHEAGVSGIPRLPLWWLPYPTGLSSSKDHLTLPCQPTPTTEGLLAILMTDSGGRRESSP